MHENRQDTRAGVLSRVAPGSGAWEAVISRALEEADAENRFHDAYTRPEGHPLRGKHAIPLHVVYALFGYDGAQELRLLEAQEPGLWFLNAGCPVEYVTQAAFRYAASSAAARYKARPEDPPA